MTTYKPKSNIPPKPSRLERMTAFFPKSLITEFGRVFGEDLLEKFIAVFGGTTIKVPSQKEIRKMERHITIYQILSASHGKSHLKLLRSQVMARFGLSKKEVAEIFGKMKKNKRMAEVLAAEDEAVGNCKLKEIKSG